MDGLTLHFYTTTQVPQKKKQNFVVSAATELVRQRCQVCQATNIFQHFKSFIYNQRKKKLVTNLNVNQ